MNQPITYQQATAADIPALVAARIAFLSESQGRQPEPVVAELRDALQAYYSQALAEGQYLCWMAKVDGELVGVGGMALRQHPGSFRNPSGRMGYLMNMYTVPVYRRRGICSTILKQLIARAEALGFRLFELHATQEGEPVYRREGFVLHGEPTYRKFTG